MQAVFACDALDGRNALALHLGGHDETAVDQASVEDDVARAAIPVVAAFLGAGQLELIAQDFEQAVAGFAQEFGFLAVDLASDVKLFSTR